uniref:Uncharacterized protein n=1 Tax=Oryza meridionalis TaxID=40149 RepID=A0A0E0CF90_9ORYZ
MFLPTILAGAMRRRFPGFPGTAPLIMTTFRSLSILTILSFLILVLVPPILPGIFFPLYTRPGVVPAPIDPRALWLLEPWVISPRLKLCLLMPPVPLPMDLPEMSTRSPSLNMSAKSSGWPGSYPSTDWRRNSCRWRSGGAPALPRWPSSGRVSFSSRTPWYPTCTASYPSVAAVFTCVTTLPPSRNPTTVTGTGLPVAGSK